jgi:Tfp pilus assembly protein PilF
MRLSEMARDRGGYSEALDHVKYALEGDKRDPEVWTAWGNIHLTKKEIQNAQKKFEQVLEDAKVRQISLSEISRTIL